MNSTSEKIFDLDKKIKQARKFGLIMGVAFTILASLLLWRGRVSWLPFASLAAFFFCTVAIYPRCLIPIEKWWMKFGEKLSFVMSIIILIITFYAFITPMAALLRLLRKDILSLRFDKKTASYWKNVEFDETQKRYYLPY